MNAQIPYELEPNKQYQVIISANGALSTPDAIQLTNVVPGLAAYADGTVIAQHADGSLITAKSPAKGGETAIAYLSGLGATDNNPASGGAAPGDILARPNSLPTLSIGGKDAKIAFVGLTPGLVGLYQMNFDHGHTGRKFQHPGVAAIRPQIAEGAAANTSSPAPFQLKVSRWPVWARSDVGRANLPVVLPSFTPLPAALALSEKGTL